MIVLDPEEQADKVAMHAVKAPVTDEYYAMVDSVTNASWRIC